MLASKEREIREMNLYCVYSKDSDYIIFVFEETLNKAKSRCFDFYCDDEEYINWRGQMLKKNVGGKAELIDGMDDESYKRVLALGCEYSGGEGE